MNSKWLRMILTDKDKEVKVAVVINGKYQLYNIVAVEDETSTSIILSAHPLTNHTNHR